MITRCHKISSPEYNIVQRRRCFALPRRRNNIHNKNNVLFHFHYAADAAVITPPPLRLFLRRSFFSRFDADYADLMIFFREMPPFRDFILSS